MKTGIIFDMDGTLWDSTDQVAKAWSMVTLPKLGRGVSREDMYRVMGMPMDRLALALFPEYSLEELRTVMKESCLVENEYLAEHGAKLYPHVAETIRELSGSYPLYIVSNCQAGYIEVFLSYYHLESYIEDFTCYGDNGKQKDENIAYMIHKHRLDRGIYVGDIQADYESALAGGADFIHAAYGFGTVDAQVPNIQTFSDLPKLLRTMAEK